MMDMRYSDNTDGPTPVTKDHKDTLPQPLIHVVHYHPQTRFRGGNVFTGICLLGVG